MGKVRVAVTLDEEVVDMALRLVGARGLSALINQLLERRLPQQRLLRLMTEMGDEHGFDDSAIRRSAREELADVRSGAAVGEHGYGRH